MENIVAVKFPVESEGYQAITQLRNNPVTADYTVSAALLAKKENGYIKRLDGFDTGIETTDDTAIGGMVGALFGIIGGPIGMLLTGSMGALMGSVVDIQPKTPNGMPLLSVVGIVFSIALAIFSVRKMFKK